MIPEQLKDLTFCKVLPYSKRAFERSWQLYQLNYSEIMKWYDEGNNYGIICSKKNGVGIIDADCLEIVLAVENLLPETFSVESSSEKKRHFYYKIKNFPEHLNKIIVADPDDITEDGGDIRMGEFYVVGPGSIHPDTKKRYEVKTNHQIAEVDFLQITDVLGQFYKTNIIKPIKVSHKFKLPIQRVLDEYKVKLEPCGSGELHGAHPIHGSETGKNFSVNPEKNVWICWRHNHGGGIIELIAMLEGITLCGEKIKPGDKSKIYDVIKEKFGLDMSVRWDVTQQNNLRGTYNNALNFLEEKEYPIRFNEHSGRYEYNGKLYEDEHALQIKKEMREIELEPTISTIDEAIKTYAKENEYNPIKEYLESLKWDGIPRAAHWLHELCGAENSEYVKFLSRTILIAAIKRIYEPGCQFDYMPIFEGAQGTYKSSLIRALGGSWYKEISLLDRDDKTIQKMRGAWFIEVAELSVFAKRDIDSLKSFLSNPIDTTRFVYDRNERDVKRKSIFIGTINPGVNGYLMDETGNRRFLPVRTGKIEIEIIKKNRDFLFAEALQLYRSGIPIYITDENIQKEALTHQKMREDHDEWADIILNKLKTKQSDIGENIRAVDAYQMFIGGKLENYDKKTALRVGKILRKLSGGESILMKINGITGKYYNVKDILSKS